MNLGDFKESRFLTKEDVGSGVVVTIKKVTVENVALRDQPAEEKPVVYFEELDKGLVCNSTNAQLIAQITGQSENVEKTWLGKKIVIYNEKNVSFAGKLTGGIRVREATKDLPF